MFPNLMRASIDLLRVYDPIVPRLRELLGRAGTHGIVDLCSGGAGPWRRLGLTLETIVGRRIPVLLTDKYPNLDAFRRVRDESGGRVGFIEESVDATNVPEQLSGVRTLFSSFHHFPPDRALAILRDAALKRAPIGIFEFTERSVFAFISMLLTPLVALMVIPFFRPFSVWRWLSCLPIPFLPLIATWDGFASNLRTYSPQELKRLAAAVSVPGYTWEAGKISGRFRGLSVTYLIGAPGLEPAASDDAALSS
jgi:hypothetical protein